MKPSELSKKKYVYIYYIGGDGMLHKECCPAIYSNAEYVYYKRYGNSHLSQNNQRCIYDTVEALKERIESLIANNRMHVVAESWLDIDIKKYQENAREIKRQAEINDWRRIVEYRKNDYERALAMLEKLENKDKE